MLERWYKKGIVVGIIVLFIGLGIQPAFAVDTNQSNKIKTIDSDKENLNKNILNGPDLKIEKVYITWGWKGEYWVPFITCDVTNIGAPIVDGKYIVNSKTWCWKYLTQTFEPCGYTEWREYYCNWGSNITKEVRGAFASQYSDGLYKIKFSVATSGDVNPENNDFKRCFHIKSYIISPSNPFDAPPEEDVLLRTPRNKATNNVLLLGFLEKFPMLERLYNLMV